MRRSLPEGVEDVQDAAASSSDPDAAARGVVPVNNVTLMISRRAGRLNSLSDDEDDDNEDQLTLEEEQATAAAAAAAATGGGPTAATAAAAGVRTAVEGSNERVESSVDPTNSSRSATSPGTSSSSSPWPAPSSSPAAGGGQDGLLSLFGQVLRRPLWTAPTSAFAVPPPGAAAFREEAKEDEHEGMVIIPLGGSATASAVATTAAAAAAEGVSTTADAASGEGRRHLFAWICSQCLRPGGPGAWRSAHSAAAATGAGGAASRLPHRGGEDEDEDEDEAADTDTGASPHPVAPPSSSSSSTSYSPSVLAAACATAVRRHHLLILWSFGGLMLLRMALVAFQRRDSKLLVFTSLVLALAVYIWWTRRVRQARLEALREAAMHSEHVAMMQHIASAREGGRGGRRGGLESVDLEELQSIMLEARRQGELQGGLQQQQQQQQQRGLSPHSKAALVRFSFRSNSSSSGYFGAEGGRGGEEEEAEGEGKESGWQGGGSGVSLATAEMVWEEVEEEEGVENGREGGSMTTLRQKTRPSMRSSSSQSLGGKQPGESAVGGEEEGGQWRRESEGKEGERGKEERIPLRWLSGAGSSSRMGLEDEDGGNGGRQGGGEGWGGHEGGGREREGEGEGVNPLLKTAHVDKHCSICLADYEEGDTLCVLPCRHSYHDDCLDHWITAHSKCPLCNYDLLLAGAATAATLPPSFRGGQDQIMPMAPRHGRRVGGGMDGDQEDRDSTRLQQQQRRLERQRRRNMYEDRREAAAGSSNVLRIVTMEA
ncbi:hypothetical protein VYU27_006716 [Nannochloropsis oceanica]